MRDIPRETESTPREYIRALTEAATFPGVVIVLFLVLMAAWRIFRLPTPEEMFTLIVDFFADYGLWVVAVGALGEGIAVFNLYFPGSAAILLGVVASEGDPMRASLVVLVATLGFFVAAQVNYGIGYFGLQPLLYRLGGRKLLERGAKNYRERGVKSLILGYFHPNIGGLISVAAGASRLDWRRFSMATSCAILGWNIGWGVLVFLAARPVRKVATSPYLVLVALALWLVGAVLLRLFAMWRQRVNAREQ